MIMKSDLDPFYQTKYLVNKIFLYHLKLDTLQYNEDLAHI